MTFTLPDWIDADVWKDFEHWRKSIKKPLTDTARKRIVSAPIMVRMAWARRVAMYRIATQPPGGPRSHRERAGNPLSSLRYAQGQLCS